MAKKLKEYCTVISGYALSLIHIYLEDIRIKLGFTLETKQIDRVIEAFTNTDEVESFLQTLRKEGVLHV